MASNLPVSIMVKFLFASRWALLRTAAERCALCFTKASHYLLGLLLLCRARILDFLRRVPSTLFLSIKVGYIPVTRQVVRVGPTQGPRAIQRTCRAQQVARFAVVFLPGVATVPGTWVKEVSTGVNTVSTWYYLVPSVLGFILQVYQVQHQGSSQILPKSVGSYVGPRPLRSSPRRAPLADLGYS